MPLASITRLRVRSIRFFPPFIWLAIRSLRQARGAAGCLFADVRRERALVFWTRTMWQDESTMRAYMKSGPHGVAMPKLQHWCDEASATHWQQESGVAPGWETVERRMREQGRTSRVRHPSPAHARGETVPA